MKKSIFSIFIVAIVAALVSFTFQNNTPPRRHPTANEAHANATCYGSKSCNACKNCKYCKHCAKDGGTCGVCK